MCFTEGFVRSRIARGVGCIVLWVELYLRGCPCYPYILREKGYMMES